MCQPAPLTAEEYAELLVQLWVNAPWGELDEPAADVKRLADAISELLKDMRCSMLTALQVLVRGGTLASQQLTMLYEDKITLTPKLPPKLTLVKKKDDDA